MTAGAAALLVAALAFRFGFASQRSSGVGVKAPYFHHSLGEPALGHVRG